MAWSVGISSIAMIVGSLVLMFVDRHAALPAAVKRWDFSDVLNEVVSIGAPTIGIVLASRRPENRMGWLFLIAGVAIGLSDFGASYGLHALVADPGSLPAGRALAWISNSVGPIPFFLLAVLFLLFPTGRPRSQRWRVVAWVVGSVFTLGTVMQVVFATRAWSNPFSSNLTNAAPPAVFIVAILAAFLACVVAAVVRFVKSVGEERLQLKWFVAAAVLELVVQFLPGGAVVSVLQSLAGLLLFAAIGVAVLKYRLYEIDVVINKTVLFASLAVFITLVYVGLVVGVGTLAGNRGSPVLSALAAAIIAVAFQPVRQRAGRLADRVVYGKRATPYEVLSEFSQRVAGTYALDDILPRMARVLGEGTGGRSEIWLRVGSSLRSVAIWPSESPPGSSPEELPFAGEDLPAFPGASKAAPVLHQGELLGAVTVTKPPSDPLRPAEEKLIEDLASQAGLVLRNARLTAELVARLEELQASRQRLVKAQDEERRKLERNIHDGAQQQLVALAVKANLAESFVGRDESKERAMLSELKTEATDALENLRDLARGIYPPLLADQGLVAALDSQARKSPVPVSVEADGVSRYPQEQEAAVYFCALEALQNVAKYAGATQAAVRLSEDDGHLRFEVTDDGVGFDPKTTGYGTGLQGMADRLAALGGELEIRSERGGGTALVGSLPIGEVER